MILPFLNTLEEYCPVHLQTRQEFSITYKYFYKFYLGKTKFSQKYLSPIYECLYLMYGTSTLEVLANEFNLNTYYKHWYVLRETIPTGWTPKINLPTLSVWLSHDIVSLPIIMLLNTRYPSTLEILMGVMIITHNPFYENPYEKF